MNNKFITNKFSQCVLLFWGRVGVRGGVNFLFNLWFLSNNLYEIGGGFHHLTAML